MTDFRSLYGKEYLGAWDLPRDVTLTIARVTQGELRTPDSKKVDKRPIVYFDGTPKGLVLNATNGKTIAGMYGVHVESWAKKRITVYATETSFGGRTVQCVRVRPKVPQSKSGGGALASDARPETTIDEAAHDVAPELSGGDENGEVHGA